MNEPPLPNYDYQVGGSLPIDAPSYVQRQADHDLYDYLKQGQFCYVLNSRQMGKSSLRVQVMQRLQQEGYACAAVDITSIGTATITPEQWYGGIINNLVNSFGLYDRFDLRTWWTEQNLLSPVQRLSLFIETVLLPQVAQPIVIFIDEIDSVLSLSFNLDDFFALIRDCFNRRADQPDYRRLTFTLLGVCTPSDLIQDRRRTPFNIGQAIELSGFQPSEAAPLLPGLAPKTQNPEAVLQAILYWTGGQPFLTQKLCNRVRQAEGEIPVGSEVQWVADLVQTQLIDQWESHDRPEHLRTIRDRILRSTSNRTARLLELYQQILQQGEVPTEASTDHMELRLSGLVVNQQAHLQVYNPIYQAIFNAEWVADAFAEIRPYAQQLQAWLQHNRKADADLLQGAQLAAALEWAESRSLSKQDYEYLVESQKLGLRQELDQISAALEQTNQQLVERNNFLDQVNEQLDAARQELARVRRRTRWATGVGLGLLGSLAIGSGWAIQGARANLGEARNQAEQAEQARQTAEKGRDAIQTENDGLEAQQKQLQAANQGLMGQNNDLEESNEDLTQQNQQVKQEVNQAKAAQQQAQQQAEVAQQTLTQARAELNQAEEALTGAQQERLQAQNEAEVAQQNATTLQARVDQQRRNLDDVFRLSESISTFTQGDSEGAIAQLSEILKANPQNTFALISRGEIYLKTNQAEMALLDFDQAIRLENNNSIAYFGRGNALTQVDPPQYKAAINAYDQAITFNPNYYQAWANRGNAYVNLGQLIEAIDSYNQSLNIEPDYAIENLKTTFNRLIEEWHGSATQILSLITSSILRLDEESEISNIYISNFGQKEKLNFSEQDVITVFTTIGILIQHNYQEDALYYLGYLLYLGDEYNAALETLNLALDSRSDFPEALTARGHIHKKLRNFEAAIEDYTHAIEISPNYAVAYLYRGLTYTDLGHFEKAQEDFNTAIEIDPYYINAYLQMGFLYYNQGDLDKAIENYSRAIDINPENYLAYFARGFVYQVRGDLEENLEDYMAAINDWNNAIEIDQSFAFSYYSRGLAHYNLNELEAAISDFSVAIQIEPGDSSAYYRRGNAYALQGDLEKAIEDFTHAIDISPQYAEAYRNRGALGYFALGNYQSAIEDFNRAIELDPSPITFQLRGKTYQLMECYEEALADFNRAIDLGSEEAITARDEVLFLLEQQRNQ